MKTLIFSLLTIAAFSSSAFADFTNFPNDTRTRLITKGNSCGEVIDVKEAYFTNFNDNGGANKALILHVTIANIAYDKEVVVTHKDGQKAVAVPTTTWWQNAASAIYETQMEGYSVLTIVDNMVGPENDTSLSLAVTMNGVTYNCSSLRVK